VQGVPLREVRGMNVAQDAPRSAPETSALENGADHPAAGPMTAGELDAGTTTQLEDITIRFGGIVAVNKISIKFAGRGCTGLIGPNGAGKTTLLDAMSGLRTPSAGKITLNGQDVTRRSAAWLARRGVRRTFQRHQAFGWLSVAENILVPLEWRTRGWGLLGDLVAAPNRRRQARGLLERVDAVVERCGLAEVRNESAASLPIGQLRLLEFARAIVDKPSVLLLDEPTSGLGRPETELLGSIMREVIREDGTSVVLVEHDIDFVMGISNRLICLDQGTLLADGTPEEIRRDPAVIAAYLGAKN
jgi:branched-chain amino acid transport system ATP-binding protein